MAPEGAQSKSRISVDKLILLNLIISKSRSHQPESFREALTSGSGGLPSLKQINGSLLLGTFSMLTFPCKQYET